MFILVFIFILSGLTAMDVWVWFPCILGCSFERSHRYNFASLLSTPCFYLTVFTAVGPAGTLVYIIPSSLLILFPSFSSHLYYPSLYFLPGISLIDCRHHPGFMVLSLSSSDAFPVSEMTVRVVGAEAILSAVEDCQKPREFYHSPHLS